MNHPGTISSLTGGITVVLPPTTQRHPCLHVSTSHKRAPRRWCARNKDKVYLLARCPPFTLVKGLQCSKRILHMLRHRKGLLLPLANTMVVPASSPVMVGHSGEYVQCAVLSKTIFCIILMSVFPVNFSTFTSIPFLMSPRAPNTTGMLINLIPHILEISIG